MRLLQSCWEGQAGEEDGSSLRGGSSARPGRGSSGASAGIACHGSWRCSKGSAGAGCPHASPSAGRGPAGAAREGARARVGNRLWDSKHDPLPDLLAALHSGPLCDSKHAPLPALLVSLGKLADAAAASSSTAPSAASKNDMFTALGGGAEPARCQAAARQRPR